MRPSTKSLLRLLAAMLTFTLIAAACGDDDASSDASSDRDEAPGDADEADEAGEAESTSDDPPAEEKAPVKIGLIAQDEELLAFPEVRSVAQAFIDYFNAELDGAEGHEAHPAQGVRGQKPWSLQPSESSDDGDDQRQEAGDHRHDRHAVRHEPHDVVLHHLPDTLRVHHRAPVHRQRFPSETKTQEAMELEEHEKFMHASKKVLHKTTNVFKEYAMSYDDEPVEKDYASRTPGGRLARE